MALTVAIKDSMDVGNGQMVVADVTFDSSYPTGGEVLLASALGMRAKRLMHVQCDPVNGHLVRFVPEAVPVQGKLKVTRAALRNSILSSPGLAIGTGSKAKVLIANTVTFLSDGVFKSKTTAEVAFTATDHDIPANASTVQEAVYALSIAGDGTVTITMGTIATGSGNAQPPAIPNGNALLGYVRIAVAAGATPFDASTDLLDAAHITDTYINAALPHDGATLGAIDDQAEVKNATNLSGLTCRVVAWGR